jgi:hypothetical protein
VDHYYETIIWHEARRAAYPPVLEALRGTQVVEWYGRIERQLVDMVNRFQTSRNFDSKAKAQAYLDIWRQNQLTGSINVDTINALLSAADILGVDSWGESNYFASLRDKLRMLKAGQEELPPIGDEDNSPGPRPRRSMGSSTPMDDPNAPSQDFGPEPEPGATVGPDGKVIEPDEPVEEPRI